MRKILIGVLLVFAAGCTSPGPLKNLNRTGTEALVVGRVLVNYNGKAASETSSVLLRKTQHLDKDKNRYFYRSQGQGPDMAIPYKLDKTGLLVMRLPLGYYAITTVRCKPVPGSSEAEYKIFEHDTTFGLLDAAKTYYIGDIHIDWKGPKMKIWTIGDEMGLTGKKGINDGELKMKVENRFLDTQSVIQKKYGKTLSYEKALLKLPAFQGGQAPAAIPQEDQKQPERKDGEKIEDPLEKPEEKEEPEGREES